MYMMANRKGNKAMKAIGYLRVSTAGQAADGISLEAQRARVESWAAAQGFDLVGIYQDAGLSGGKAHNRPGLQRAIKAACKQGAAIVVYSLSRLARSTRDAIEISERLDRAGADLVSLSERIDTTSAAGKMVFRMLAVMAEFERDLVSERTSMALSHIRAQGRKTGGDVPFGFDADADGNLIENKAEQAALELIFSLREDGLSLQKIADELNRRGISTKRGKTWFPATVRNVLKRKVA